MRTRSTFLVGCSMTILLGGCGSGSETEVGQAETALLILPQRLATEPLGANDIRRIAADDRSVFWAVQGEFWNDYTPAVLRRVAKSGGPVATLASRSEETTADFALDSENAYWLTYAYDMTKPAGQQARVRLLEVSKRGDGSRTLVDEYGAEHPFSVTTDAANIYWVMSASVRRLSKNAPGAEPEVLVAPAPDRYLTSIALDETNVYYTDLGRTNPATGCAAGEGKVWRVAKRGGAPQAIATGESCLLGVHVDSTFAYWVDLAGELRSAPKWGGRAVTLATGVSVNQVPGADIAVDTFHIYYASRAGADGMAVFRVHKLFPIPLPLFGTQDGLIQTVSAVDLTSVYYLRSGDGGVDIMRALKPWW